MKMITMAKIYLNIQNVILLFLCHFSSEKPSTTNIHEVSSYHVERKDMEKKKQGERGKG